MGRTLAITNAAVVDLNPENFEVAVKDPSKNVFVMFYAPWCGYCTHMMPEWNKLGKLYKAGDDVVIARVDANKYSEIATNYDIKGFPTLRFFTKDNKDGIDFRGARQVSDFNAFVIENKK